MSNSLDLHPDPDLEPNSAEVPHPPVTADPIPDTLPFGDIATMDLGSTIPVWEKVKETVDQREGGSRYD